MASTYLTRTPSSNGSETKSTLSMWFKRSNLSSQQTLYFSSSSSDNKMIIRFNADDTFDVRNKVGGSFPLDIETNRKFRDTNAWYHFVLKFDTTQATSSDRFKMYVNGVQETSFSTETYPSQNANLSMNQTDDQLWVGAESGTGAYFDGLITHAHWTDGYAYDASTFGSTDSTTGEWKINTSPSVTYGTNGFFILKDGNSVTDQSGNSNNFTVYGNLTNTEDCPSNVFATWNPLSKSSDYNGQNLPINGNTTFVSGETGTNYPAYWSTLGASSGKFYFECKMGSSGGAGAMIGVSDQKKLTSYFGSGAYDYGYFGYDGTKFVSGSASSYGNSYGNNDIVGCAVDLDNNKLYFSKNGVWQNSGDPTSGSTGTGAISIADASSTTTGFYFFTAGDSGNTDAPTVYANFGNGYFGTTAISSEGTNASNIGKFEYDVPTGYTALSTKGLNE